MKNRILTIIFSLFILIFMNINVYAREDIGLKDGFYKVNISLWHSTEDKASMGNRAMNQSAQIEVKDNKIMLYMESEKIKIQDIESSMLNFYTLDSDKNYKKAEEACYEIEIKNEKSKRPRLFRINLYKKDTFTDVLIDPKVEVMGKDPIKARLKINWDSLEEIKEDEASFIRDFKNDLKENKKEADFKEDNEVLLYYTDKSFNEDFDFSVKKLTENEKFDLKNYNFNDFTAYKVKISKKLNIIPGDFKGLIDYLREDIKPSDEINIKIPLKDNKSINLYKIHDSKKIKINYEIKDNYIDFKDSEGGLYIVEKSDTGLLKTESKKSEKVLKSKKYIMPAVKTNNILDTDNASKTDIKTIDNKIKTKVLTEENPQKLKSIHNTFENKEEIKEVRENKYIIILLIFLSMLIMYFSLYTIKKYKEKLIEEMNIYFELRKRMREYEK